MLNALVDKNKKNIITVRLINFPNLDEKSDQQNLVEQLKNVKFLLTALVCHSFTDKINGVAT